ncbi:hypothetical protein [Streptosporangium sp. NPDC002721]|uniref:hypothetical protein n=1 Tax=Streptosporangium sp. NPDC002721 TaxID=3366188 RepID=UPI00367CB0D6
MVLLVVRSGCAECGTAAADPQPVGWIDPATGVFTAGPLPAGVGPCDGGCLDVTTVQLCDLTPGGGCVPFLRHLLRDCDGAITSSTDTALDGTTAYTVVGTAGDCSACAVECVDTICVQRCDDTDGDGQADQTYSELWCVHADGSTELVLTYADDPSQPYTPLAPVECAYGCPESQTVLLCDDSGAFLRRYTFLAGTATYEDVALDGQTPHVVTGTVGACAGDGESAAPCEEQTTPAATLGLCLADGTPIAVVVTRDCAGTVTQDGWINLTTGTWSAGSPPAGAQACGDSRAFGLAGLLCDVDLATGDVLGLVLVEYEYNPDGSLASVRLVDPATGTTYTLQGELRNCPGGSAAQPEQDLVVLCDTAADGTVTAFLRDYRRDAAGAITGHSDYALDGAAYVPAGTVGSCPESSSCRQCQTQILCDTPAGMGTADVPGNTANGPGTVAGTLSNGVDYAITGTTRFNGQQWWGIGAAGTGPQVWTFTQPVTATWAVRIILQNQCAVLPEGSELVELSATHTWDPATRTLCTTVNSDQSTSTFRHSAPVTSLSFDMSGPGNTPTRMVGLMAVTPVPVTFQRTTCRDCDGEVTSTTDTTLDGQPYTPAGTVGVCGPTAGTGTEPCGHSEALPLCDVATDGTSTPFLRHLVYDCAGAVTGTADTALDGTTPYTPAGTVGLCPTESADDGPLEVGSYPLCVIDNASGNVLQHVRREVVYDAAGDAVAERFVDAVTGGPVAIPGGAHLGVCPSEHACQDCQTVPLCDTGVDNSSFEQVPISILPNGGGGLGNPDWPYGSVGVNQGAWVASPGYWITVPPQAQQWQIGMPVYMRLGIKGLAPGETISINTAGYVVESLSPNHILAGNVLTGGPASTAADETILRYDTPRQQFILQPQSGDGSGLSFLQVSLEQPWATEATVTPFLRTVCRDCDGAITSTTDTTLDGEPYTPAGTVGVCGLTAGAGTEPCGHSEALPLCDVATDGTITPFLRHLTYDCTGAVTGIADTALDGTTPYTAAGTVGVCSPQPESCPVQVIEQCRCDDTDGDGVGDTDYVELLGVACDGTLTPLGIYTADLAGPYTPVAPVECPVEGAPEPGCPQHLLRECRWDDTTGDGLGDTTYVELILVDGCTGQLTSLGSYLPDLTGPYTPVAPTTECPVEGAPSASPVQARRVQLDPGGTWGAAAVPLLQSVTATAHGGNGVVTTMDGDSTLFAGESITWSTQRDADVLLVGPLTITAQTGTVTITYTTGVTL